MGKIFDGKTWLYWICRYVLPLLLRLIIHILTRNKIISKINNISIIHTKRLDLLVIDRYNSYTTFENDFHTPNVQIEQSIDLIHSSRTKY
jgi:hypothetical protein